MNNNNNLFDENTTITEKDQKIKKITNFISRTILLIMLIFLVDFTYTLVFKAKPIITINKTEDKYSSILYDVYICDNEQIIRFKTQKYTCKINNNQEENTNNNSNNTNNNIDNNNNNTNNNINDTTNNDTATNNNDNDKQANNNSEANNNKSDITNNTNSNIIVDEGNIKIIDKSSGDCLQAIDYYYEDSNYKYYFTCIKSNSIYVIKNGKEYTIKYALNNNIVTMDELVTVGFKPLKESKNLVDR